MDIRDTIPASEIFSLGRLVIEGKTKKIHEIQGRPGLAMLVAKDDITAGDGARRDSIPEKGRLATATACNVFRLLQQCGVPVAFQEQYDSVSFIAPHCAMLPYEVVVRREAHGSYLKRNPHLSKGQIFPQLLVEFFLKTKDRVWKDKTLICDDPYMLHDQKRHEIFLFNPAEPSYGQKPFLTLQESDVFSRIGEGALFPEMRRIARQTFLILEKAWQMAGRTLVDFKVEFGVTSSGELLLADVIDNDSWRVLENGAYIDKQVYRDGGSLSTVGEKYRHVAELTAGFRLPRQRIIIWKGSEKDKTDSIFEALSALPKESVMEVTCSVHKEPARAVMELDRLVQEVPDSVVIAFIGRSNGAGPTLSAVTNVPVITIPASFKEFPEDVWSCLRTPSNVPVMTVLEPVNAAQAAIRILAGRNPQLYAQIRLDLETRLVNVMRL